MPNLSVRPPWLARCWGQPIGTYCMQCQSNPSWNWSRLPCGCADSDRIYSTSVPVLPVPFRCGIWSAGRARSPAIWRSRNGELRCPGAGKLKTWKDYRKL